jgi:chaperonin cofactor prefoldin
MAVTVTTTESRTSKEMDIFRETLVLVETMTWRSHSVWSVVNFKANGHFQNLQSRDDMTITTRKCVENKILELEGNIKELQAGMDDGNNLSSHNSMYRNSIRMIRERIEMLQEILNNSEG